MGGHRRNPFLRCIPHLRRCCWPPKGSSPWWPTHSERPKCSVENARPSTRQRPHANHCPATATPAQVSGVMHTAGGPREAPGVKLAQVLHQVMEQMGEKELPVKFQSSLVREQHWPVSHAVSSTVCVHRPLWESCLMPRSSASHGSSFISGHLTTTEQA